jgi:hypothetical protein
VNSDSYYNFWYLSFHLCSAHNIQIYYTWKIKIPPRVEGTIIVIITMVILYMIDKKYYLLILFISSPCQRQCELLPSLGICRPLTFHILIFSYETSQPYELKLGQSETRISCGGHGC